MPTHITPGVQRMLDRFGDAPVSVLDASWSLLAWNPLWGALLGDPSSWRERERNLVWRAFHALPTRAVLTDAEHERWRSSAVADLRIVVARYPDDASLVELVADLSATSPRFTAAPGSRDAEALALVGVVGLQTVG